MHIIVYYQIQVGHLSQVAQLIGQVACLELEVLDIRSGKTQLNLTTANGHLTGLQL